MHRIRFLSDQIYEVGGPGKGINFPKDFVLDRDDVGHVLGVDNPTSDYATSFLRRWTNRGVAEPVDGSVDISDFAEITVTGDSTSSSVTHPFGFARHGRATTGIALPSGDDDGVPDDDLDGLTRAELDALALDRGVDISQAKNKGDVIAALRAAAAEA